MNDPNEGIETVITDEIFNFHTYIIEMNDPNEGIETDTSIYKFSTSFNYRNE